MCIAKEIYIPLLVVAILTFHLVKFLYESRKLRISVLANGIYYQGEQSNVPIDYLTKVLTIIAFVYIICMIPGAIYAIVGIFIDKGSCTSAFSYFVHIADSLAFLNSSLNFFIYYLNIPTFRKCLINILTKCCIKKKAKDLYAVQSSRM